MRDRKQAAVIMAVDWDRSPRVAALVDRFLQASEALISLAETIAPERWMSVPKPGVWSPGKEAEHVADGAAYHQWIVRLSLGEKVPPRPHIERAQLTARGSQQNVVDLLRQQANESVTLIAGLTDEQLDLPVRPPRARSPTLAQMIESVLVGHYDVHRTEIEAKLRIPVG